MNYRPYGRRSIEVLSVLVALTGFMFAWVQVAKLQSREMPAAENDAPVTIRAAKRGNPYINFDDGRELDLGANASGTQPVALVSADFDSDGIADVVTADTTGKLQLLKGRDPAIFALDPNRKEQAKPEPFTAVALDAALGISPDMMFAGDFNADGKQDILGLTKGASGVVVVLGDGFGHFSRPTAIPVNGSITAAEAGEIGRPDGQADLAVAVTNQKGSFLVVFEHPESAFKHAPEMIKLPAPATALAIGNMDEDFYSDIAVACGNDVVIVHERGQAYPWDIFKDSEVVRPPAVVEVRKMPFTIASMAVGRFGDRRGTSLAMLGGDGNIYQLEPAADRKKADRPTADLKDLKAVPYRPTDHTGRRFAMASEITNPSNQVDPVGFPIVDRATLGKKSVSEFLEDQRRSAAETDPKVDPASMARLAAVGKAQTSATRERATRAFIRTISAASSPVAKWSLKAITSDSPLARMSGGGDATLTRLNVSDSNLDDLMVTSRGSGEIQFVSRQKNGGTGYRSEVSSITSDSVTEAVLPLNLNLDGINDLVILRAGSKAPSVVVSAPMAFFAVNTTDDTPNCFAGGECSLRGAILQANANFGNDIIGFALPAGTVLSPQTQLPSITDTLSIQGGNLPDGTKAIEISGADIPAPADGLKIRTSNCFIYNLAINGFKSISSGGSDIGGNGIVIESDSTLQNNGHNSIYQNYLGTDPTGSLRRGNEANGLLIFDSDSNGITQNVISGNGTHPIYGDGMPTKYGNGVSVIGGNSNGLSGNIIGLNAQGNAKLGNYHGIFLTGANNEVGNEVGGGNTISGNGVEYNEYHQCLGFGIYNAPLYDADTQELLTVDNTVQGNRIGTDPSGTVGLGNCWRGIQTYPIVRTVIGSITEDGRNTISGNQLDAIWCGDLTTGSDTSEGGYCAIAGNNIGTDVTGTQSVYNSIDNIPLVYPGSGVVTVLNNYSLSNVGAPGGTSQGGACTGFCNLISGNDSGGVAFDADGALETGGVGTIAIFNNYIGTNRDGTQALANPYTAVVLASTNVEGAAPTTYLGGYGDLNGQPVSAGNLISGNHGTTSVATNNLPGAYFISGNLFGTDATGTSAIPNSGTALSISANFLNIVQIGDSDPLGRNIISGNVAQNGFGGDGIYISSGYGIGIYNNLIGVNANLAPLGNQGSGINISQLYAYATVVGGSTENANVIANNSGTGVRVNGGSAFANSIRGNSIYDNGALGIDLTAGTAFNPPDGVTINDDCENDSDNGPNGLQNFPVLDRVVVNPDGSQTISGILRSHIRETYGIDLYANNTADPSGYGEGQIYYATVNATTDSNGFAQFSVTLPPGIPSFEWAATATDGFGNTSEFSLAADTSTPLTAVDKTSRPAVCQIAIVVNIDSDEPDANINDSVCDVDLNTDGLQCSLRAAMEEANHRPGYQRIIFAIPGAGVHTILPQTQLPGIVDPVDIDATTQDPASPTPTIWIKGDVSTADTALGVSGVSAYIRGFAITGFSSTGIYATGSAVPFIESCHIGIAPDGVTADPEREDADTGYCWTMLRVR